MSELVELLFCPRDGLFRPANWTYLAPFIQPAVLILVRLSERWRS